MRRQILLAGLLASLMACGTEKQTETEDLNPDPGLSREGGVDGVAYPKGPTGPNVGDTVKNFTLYGIRDPSKPLKVDEVRMSDFYDPNGVKKARLMWINVAAGWCGPCKQEMAVLVPKCEENKDKGLVCYTSLFESDRQGAVGYEPATNKDIEDWANTYGMKTTIVVDPFLKWGLYFDRAATPMNMLVDPRTMKILMVDTGFDEKAINAAIALYLK